MTSHREKYSAHPSRIRHTRPRRAGVDVESSNVPASPVMSSYHQQVKSRRATRTDCRFSSALAVDQRQTEPCDCGIPVQDAHALQRQPTVWKMLFVLSSLLIAGCTAQEAYNKLQQKLATLRFGPRSTYDYVEDLKRYKRNPDKRREAYVALADPKRYKDDAELRDKILGIMELALQGERDELVRMQAATALGQFPQPPAQQALDKGKDDPSPLVRQEVAKSVALILQPEGDSTLLHLLKDEVPDVRARAAMGLGFWSTRQTVYALVDALQDKDAAVRLRARRALQQSLGSDLGTNPAAWRKWLKEHEQWF